jgi:hypothetical protein
MAIGGSGKGIQIVVGTDYNDRDLKRAQRDLDRLKGQAAKTAGPMAKLGNTLRANVGPALAMAAAAAGALAVKFAVDGVKAAAAEQAAVERLSVALENVKQGFALGPVEDYIDSLARATGVADDELRPAMITLVNATQDATEAQNLLALALDVSVGSGKDLNSIVLALAKAANGQASSLRRLGVPLSDAAIKSNDLAVISAELSQTFGGQAARAAQTYEGQMKRLNVALGELQEAFGAGFFAGLGDTADGTDDLTDAIKNLEPAFELLGQSLGETVVALGDIVVGLQGLAKELGVPAGPSWLSEFLGYILGLPGLVKTGAAALGLFTDDTESVTEAHRDYRDAAVRARQANLEGSQSAEDYAEEQRLLAEETAKAAEEFDKFAAAISKSEAVVSFGRAVRDVEKAFKNAGTAVDPFTKKGQENYQLLQDLVKETASYTEGQTTLAGKTAAASQGLATLADAMANSTMDPATRALLLEPIQALIDDLEEAGVDTSGLQAQLDSLKSKDITVKVSTVVTGDRLPPGTAAEWYGTAVGGIVPKRFAMGGSAKGMDTIPAMLTPGEFVIRRQAVKQFGTDLFSQLNRGINPLAGMTPAGGSAKSPGFQIGTINVQAAPGERAETSLPRALRRASFLAGVNG